MKCVACIAVSFSYLEANNNKKEDILGHFLYLPSRTTGHLMTCRIWLVTRKQSQTPKIYMNASNRKAEQKVPGFILHVL